MTPVEHIPVEFPRMVFPTELVIRVHSRTGHRSYLNFIPVLLDIVMRSIRCDWPKEEVHAVKPNIVQSLALKPPKGSPHLASHSLKSCVAEL